MRLRGKRHVRRPPDLTSLFDVLFIVVFVALIRAAAAQQEVARLTAPPPPKPAPPAPPAAVAALRVKALEGLEQNLAERTPLVVRLAVQVDGDRSRVTIAALEHEGQTLPLDVPLLTDSRDPDAEVVYLGDTSAELRVCRIAAVHLRLTDLSRHLVILVPDRSHAELKHVPGSEALLQGLQKDIGRCFVDQRGVASLIDPAELAPPAPPASSPAAPSPP